MLKAVFFDLDGTLLPMKEMKFAKIYFFTLYKKVRHLGIRKRDLYKALYIGALSTIKNDGSITNEKCFWDSATKILGTEILNHLDLLISYYNNEYIKTKRSTKSSPKSKKIVEFCRELGLKTVLSTNPIFPKEAVLNRMKFVNLEESHFDYITTYNNSSYCKPNHLYFIDLLNKLNLKPEEVLVIGNNEIEDAECAKKAGIESVLIDRCLIHKSKIKDIQTPIISIDECMSYIHKIYNERKDY